MPATYQGTQFRSSGDPVLFVEPPAGVSRAQQAQQLELLRKFNELHGPASPDNAELMARIASYELAFRMQTSVPEAVDLKSETPATRGLYRLDDPVTGEFGHKCLIARRLVERGVRFIELYSGGADQDNCWDAHANVDKNHELHAAETDKPIAALLTDLKARPVGSDSGCLGRRVRPHVHQPERKRPGPQSTGPSAPGWPAAESGAGSIGATDEFGYAAAERKVHVHDLHATILHSLGLDHTRLTYSSAAGTTGLRMFTAKSIEGIT